MSQIQRIIAAATAPLFSLAALRRIELDDVPGINRGKRSGTRFLLAAVLACGDAGSAFGASFNCSRAGSAAEKVICGDAELSSLDERLAKTYKQAKLKSADRREFSARSDGFWRWREKNCQTRACLLDWYQQRQLMLDAELAGAPLPATTLQTLAATSGVPAPAIQAQTVTPEQVQQALAQVQKLIEEPDRGAHFFLTSTPQQSAVGMPLQPHYLSVVDGAYVYEDLNEASVVDSRPRAMVRYRGKLRGEYTLEVQKKAGKIRYTCDSDCTYIKQLMLPGYGLHDLDVVKNDHASLASIIMRDAMNGLLVESD